MIYKLKRINYFYKGCLILKIPKKFWKINNFSNICKTSEDVLYEIYSNKTIKIICLKKFKIILNHK